MGARVPSQVGHSTGGILSLTEPGAVYSSTRGTFTRDVSDWARERSQDASDPRKG